MAMIQGESCQLDLGLSTLYAKKVFLMRCKCLLSLGCLRRASGLRSPTLKMTLSQMSEQQQALYDALNLDRYLPA